MPCLLYLSSSASLRLLSHFFPYCQTQFILRNSTFLPFLIPYFPSTPTKQTVLFNFIVNSSCFLTGEKTYKFITCMCTNKRKGLNEGPAVQAHVASQATERSTGSGVLERRWWRVWGRRLLVHLLLKAAVAEVFPALLSPSWYWDLV